MPSLTVKSNNKIEMIFDHIIELIRERPAFWSSKDADVKLKSLVAEIRKELECIENQTELNE